MNAWSTRPGGHLFPPPGVAISPSLLFQKWHAYDLADDGRRTLEPKGSRVAYLNSVAQAVDRVVGGEAAPYTAWHDRYTKALAAVGVEDRVGLLVAPTVWRLVAGLGSNPALEAGLHLHPLLGFPLIPGSAVRGLVHHVAEMTLGEEERANWPEELDGLAARDQLDRRRDEVDAFLRDCERVRTLFGSLHLESKWKEAKGSEAATPEEGDPMPVLPRALLERWQAVVERHRPQEGQALRKRIEALLETTGGRLVFYDAVPKPGQSGLLQPDLVNPHYPAYYREVMRGDGPITVPPSDDQDPVPFYFLAVAPGKTFEFRFRWQSSRTDGDAEAGMRTEGMKKARGWLREALELWGAGGKTAAGYGYFELPPEAERTGVAEGADEERPRSE